MPSKTIIEEIYHFLVKFPPFDMIEEADLKWLSSKMYLKYFEKNEEILHQGDKALPYFYIVKKGSIQIIQKEEYQSHLVNTCDEGDIFGLRASIAEDQYLASAYAEEDSLLYTIPIEFFKELMAKNPKISLYLAAGFASGVSVFKAEEDEETRQARNFFSKKQLISNALATETIEIHPNKKVIYCLPVLPICEAAQMMTQHNIGSLLVAEDNLQPLGIITDSDFRKKVVNQEKDIRNEAVATIMSAPVKTVRPNLTIAELTLAMVSHKITHLCVTEDGTDQSRALAIVSIRDLVIAQGNNPAVLIKEMLNATDTSALKKIRDKAENLVESYLHQEVGIPFISHIITDINDVLIQKAIEISIEKQAALGYKLPEVDFCWLSLGSEGRKEQLLRTDQDNALVFEPPADESKLPQVREYFLTLAKKVTDILIESGFEQCPADMMASNPKWCLSLTEWENLFRDWIEVPDPEALLHSNIFFDFRPVAGNEKLALELRETVFNFIDKSSMFLPFLAKNALQNPPPLGFFRNFIVEKSGEHKNDFDIKARAMMPLADAARVLAYEYKLKSFDSTFERYQEAGRIDPNLSSLCEAAAQAYEILIRLRAQNGIKNKDSGRYIDLDQLNKLDRQTLRNIFKTIEKVQQHLELRYQLALIRG